MNTYMLLKHLHMTMAVLTLLGFILRGIWMFMESPKLEHKLTRILPHIIDTLLLGSAIGLVIITRLYPIEVFWVTLKIILLVLYIILGTFALKRGRTKTIRGVCFFASLLTILGIFAVAGIKPLL